MITTVETASWTEGDAITTNTMDRNKQVRPPRKTPEVFKKINPENLLVIERGLLGDVPEKFRPPPQVPAKTRPTKLEVTKQCDLPSYPPIPDSPELQAPTPNEETPSPTLKKSFSFRNKFSRLSFFVKDKPQLADRRHKMDEDTAKKDVMDIHTSAKAPDNKYNSKDKDQEYKSKRFWMFKSKNEKKTERPTYKRSKSFEFLPRALDEVEEVTHNTNTHTNNLTKNRHSFIQTSSIEQEDDDDVFETSHKRAVFDLYKVDEVNITNKKHLFKPHDDSSLSTINTSTNSSIKLDNPLLGPSFLDLCQEFDKTVELFNENYLSDSEPYTKENRDNNITNEITKKEKRKSSSFSSLPSPKVLHLNTVKVTEISDDFKNELLKVTSEKSAQNALLGSKSARRGSVTDWFVLEEPSRLASDDNRYRRAQKKPINRVRRMSSTKYVSKLQFLLKLHF